MPKRAYAASGATGPRQGQKKKVRRTYTGTAASAAWRASPQFTALNRRAVASKETGFVDLAVSSYNFDTTGSIVLIATVPQGASVNQRVGKKIMWKSIQMRGRYTQNSAGLANDCTVLIVYDKRPTGTLPAITDILVTASSSSFNNDANSGRFKILKREDFQLVGNLAAQNMTEITMRSADCFLKVPLPAEFMAAGTGAIGDISLGALYLVTVGNNTAGTSAAAAQVAFRTRFIDV